MEPTFVRKDDRDGAVWSIYRSDDAESARAFLTDLAIKEPLQYVVVETPEGTWGADLHGVYLERLLQWQADLARVECDGSILTIANSSTVAAAADDMSDNFTAIVKCGKCDHGWLDGLRYQNHTAVRCPSCEAVNKIDSTHIRVGGPSGIIRPGSMAELIAGTETLKNIAAAIAETGMPGLQEALGQASDVEHAIRQSESTSLELPRAITLQAELLNQMNRPLEALDKARQAAVAYEQLGQFPAEALKAENRGLLLLAMRNREAVDPGDWGDFSQARRTFRETGASGQLYLALIERLRTLESQGRQDEAKNLKVDIAAFEEATKASRPDLDIGS
jgi:phage FluMu protein Com